MRVSLALVLPVVLLSTVNPAHAGGPTSSAACTAFLDLVKKTYTFRPSKLVGEERKQKSAAMDEVWSAAEKDPANLVPCLKTALVDPGAQAWFLVDGSALLLKLDHSKAAKEIYVRNWGRANLEDADSRIWVASLSSLASSGLDVSEAALNLIAHPIQPYNLPQHATMIDTKGAAFFLMASMDEAQSRPLLGKILDDSHSPLRQLAVSMLIAQATPDAVRDLKKLDSKTLPKPTQDEIKEYLAPGQPPLKPPSKPPTFTRQVFMSTLQKSMAGDAQAERDFSAMVTKDDWAQDAAAVLTVEDLPTLRQVRRYVAARVNPHVMKEYQNYTALIETVNRRALAQAR